MTAEVEQRIVEMRFDNEQFEKGAKQTLSTLEKLDGILDMLGSGGGMDHLSSALDAMEYRFSRLGIAGAAAIERITGKVITLASNVLTAIPQQIMAGGETRAMNIEQARFQLKGLGVAWDDLSDSIDYAVMGTAYGVDEAAKIASILVASKVDFKNAADGATDLGHALRGISGIAGMTNSSFEEIGNLMGDIFAMGKLSTRQLQSFELRGLNVAAKLSELSQNGQLKHLGDDAKYTEEQIRDLVSKGKIDALTFAKAMDAAFGEHATKANETYTGALRNLKASLSRIGEPFFTAWHEGLRKIFLSARQTFDRVKAIVKPFAEGKFTKVIDTLSDKVVKFLNNFDLRWLDKIVDFLNRSDAWFKPVDFFIDRLNDLNEISKRLFSSGAGRKGIGDKYEWVYDIKDTLTKIKAIVSDMLPSSQSLANAAKNILGFVSSIRQNLTWVTNKALDKIAPKTGKIRDFLSGILQLFGTAATNFKKLGDSLGKLGYSVFNLFTTIFQKLFKNIEFSGDNNVFTQIGNALTNLIDKYIVPGIDKLTAFVDKITEIVDKGTSAESALGRISNAFQNLGTFVDNTKDKIVNFIRSLLGIKEGQTLWERFSEVANNLKEGPLKSFGEAIRSTFGTDDSLGDKVKKVFAALIAGFIAFRKFQKVKWGFERLGRVFDLLRGQWDGLSTLANLPNRISTVFSNLSGALRAMTDNLNAKSLVEIGKAVLIMAVGIGILSLIDTDKAVVAIEAMITSLLALMMALGFMTKYLKVGLNLSIVAPVLVALAASLLAIAVAIGILSLVPTEKLIGSVLAMGAVLLGLIIGLQQLSAIMTLTNPIKLLAAAIAVGLLAAAMVILAGAMLLFTLIPADRMTTAWLSMSAALLTVVVAVGMLSKLMNPASMIAGAVALIGIAAALILIGVAVHMFKGIDISELLPLAATLMTLILALGLMSKFLNPLGMMAAAVSLILLGGALIILAVGLGALSYVTSKDENALLNLAGLLIIVGIALAALSTVAPMALVAALALAVAGAALLIGAIGLLVLSVALNAFNDVKVNPDYLLSLGGALAALGIAGVIFGLGGLGLLIGGAGLLVLALALNMMAGVKVQPDYLLAIGGAISALGIAGLIFGLGGLGLITGGVGLILLAKGLREMSDLDFNKLDPRSIAALGLGLVALGIAGVALMAGSLGLVAGGEALSEFSACLPPLAEGVKAFDGVNLKELGSLFAALSMAIPALIGLNFAAFSNVGALKDLGEALIPLAAGIKAFNEVGFWDLAKMFGGLATALAALLGLNFASVDRFSVLANSMDLLATSLGKLPSDAADKLKSFANAIRDNKQDPIAAMNELLDAIIESIKNHEIPATNAMRKLLSAIGKEANSETYKNNWRTIGGNIAIGIANGITSRTAEAANSMRRLASSLQKSFTVSLQIRSPSKVFENLAEYIPMGIARGIQNGESEITNSMASSMTGAMNLFDQYSRHSDFSPTVTPVMDMSNMRRDMGYANHIFQGTSLGQFGGVSGLHVSGDAISYNMQNKDVVTEIKHLGTKVSQLGEAFEKMQMILDTGALVGQIAPGINRELGVIAIRERRQ